jgi:hypothetical protein
MCRLFAIALASEEPDQILPGLLFRLQEFAKSESGTQLLATIAAWLKSFDIGLEAAFERANQANTDMFENLQSGNLLRNLGVHLEEQFLIAFSDYTDQSRCLRILSQSPRGPRQPGTLLRSDSGENRAVPV